MVGNLPNPRAIRPSPIEHSSYLLLISLALDGMLAEAEQQRLDRHLEQCADCRQQWTLWQVVDQRLHASLTPELSADFAEQVRARLCEQERRRTAHVGLIVTVLTILVWSVGLVGAGLLAGFMIYANLGWFTETLRLLTYGWAAVSIVGRSLWGVLVGLAETPTALAAVTAYAGLSVLALAGWFQFLRRSTQPVTH